ncbi:Dihydroorotate dehydrogenase (quinone), mitochondrial [Gracilariopsis chorda]|uniref:Dihydroorotate dehydrogenase (quinone), mitochondrial n=1 Tax=Gracilariopsis chorda TaxID=448386 RepID=A0A2V3IIA1_9FLOR|nr:Dihydroorotate dehydrogenase (quinone), mitochondrial [Gracilariopsis chorda]|eukprot:PXF41768.1 Dihydroorotate dehydrogenase (quinone), mitochondrial [Gracilariopsis chorda]
MSLRFFARAAAASAAALYTYAATADLYQGPVARYMASIDPERAHRLALWFTKHHLAVPRLPFLPRPPDPPRLRTAVWGLSFSNPVGLAAGFDKHAEAMAGLFALGFGFVEVGSVTPRAQPGNPPPRLFRLPQDAAVINRYGFNSDGMHVVFDRLSKYDSGGRSQHLMGPLGVNLAKNRHTEPQNAVDDYAAVLLRLGDLAEYVVVNVSSPNTPGLRSLQNTEQLTHLLRPLLLIRDQLLYRPPLLVKIAPDMCDQQLRDVCKVVRHLNVDGIIISNTTVSREGLKSPNAIEPGGLSGRPLKRLSTELIRKAYAFTEGAVPIVGVGGIENGQDAYDKIRAGASLVQLYTALVYHGPRLVQRVKAELDALLERDGFESVADAVGADHRAVENS